MALGIGANTVIFSVVNTVLLVGVWLPARRAGRVDPVVALLTE